MPVGLFMPCSISVKSWISGREEVKFCSSGQPSRRKRLWLLTLLKSLSFPKSGLFLLLDWKLQSLSLSAVAAPRSFLRPKSEPIRRPIHFSLRSLARSLYSAAVVAGWSFPLPIWVSSDVRLSFPIRFAYPLTSPSAVAAPRVFWFPKLKNCLTSDLWHIPPAFHLAAT